MNSSRISWRAQTLWRFAATFSGSDRKLTFIAFYADCRHEVRPVKEGHRIVLTYNLMAVGDGAAAASAAEAAPATVDALTESLRQHVLCFHNETNTRWLDSMAVPLTDGDTITILQAVSGG